MKITAFNGTHKIGQSNTAIMVEAFLQGAADAGAETEHIRLAGMTISPCRACKACWQNTPGACVIKDDMAALIEKFINSDMVILASPVYTDNISGLLKVFLDRLITIGDPHWELDEHGESRHRRRYPKPTQLITISNCGYPEQSHFAVMQVFFRRLCRNMHLELAGEIYRGAGGLLSGIVPEFSEHISSYLQLVRRAGNEAVTAGRVSPELLLALEAPLIPLPDFNKIFLAKVNMLADSMNSSA